MVLIENCLIINPLDARTLVDRARIEAQNHRFTFDEVREQFSVALDN